MEFKSKTSPKPKRFFLIGNVSLVFNGEVDFTRTFTNLELITYAVSKSKALSNFKYQIRNLYNLSPRQELYIDTDDVMSYNELIIIK